MNPQGTITKEQDEAGRIVWSTSSFTVSVSEHESSANAPTPWFDLIQSIALSTYLQPSTSQGNLPESEERDWFVLARRARDRWMEENPY